MKFLILLLVVLVGCSGDERPTIPDLEQDTGSVDTGITSDSGTATDSGVDASETADAGDSTDATLDDSGTTPPTFWTPAPGTTWAWQLSGAIDTSVDVDAYDVDMVETSDAVLEKLRADGRIIICYFSAGTREDYRDDANDFPTSAVGKTLPEWPDEKWLDIRDTGVRQVMLTRMDFAKSRGCDAIEPDNVDGYANDSGFPLTEADQVDYLRFLAREGHERGLSVGLKNAVDLVDQVVDDFDWALNEECVTYNECDTVRPFIDAGKAVFHAEYVDRQNQGMARRNAVCADTSRAGFSTLIKVWDLDAWFLTCP